MTGPDSPRSSAGPFGEAAQRYSADIKHCAPAGPASFRANGYQLGMPGSFATRRPSLIQALPVGPPGRVPEISEYYDVMESAESWSDRRKSHSLSVVWRNGRLDPVVEEPECRDQEQVGQSTEGWQQYLNVPLDDQPPPSPDPDLQQLSHDSVLATLDIEHLRDPKVFDERATAFSEGRSWIDTHSAMPWTRDEIVSGREAWFSSGQIHTVPLLAHQHWDVTPSRRSIGGIGGDEEWSVLVEALPDDITGGVIHDRSPLADAMRSPAGLRAASIIDAFV